MSIQFEKIVHEVKKLFVNVRMFQIIVHVFQKIFIKFKKMFIYFTKKKIIGTFYRIDALDRWKKTIYAIIVLSVGVVYLGIFSGRAGPRKILT
jgi:hypothetical protein